MPTLQELARAEPQRRMTTLEKLGQTWPVRMGRSVLSAMALPGDVYAGRTQPGTDDYYNRSTDLAGLAMSGGTLGGVQGVGPVLGSGPVRRAALPMDEASRMARAKQMGFDVDAPLYHGTSAKRNFREFKTGDGGVNELGEGIYFTRDPKDSTLYFYTRGEGGRVIPAVARDGDFFDFSRLKDKQSPAGENLRKEAIERYIRNNKSGYTEADAAMVGEMFDRARGSGDLTGFLKIAGYRGAVDPTSQVPSQVNIFDPKDIRSTFAKFDPAKSDSANLLASGNNPIMGGAMATQNQDEDLGSILNRALAGTP